MRAARSGLEPFLPLVSWAALMTLDLPWKVELQPEDILLMDPSFGFLGI